MDKPQVEGLEILESMGGSPHGRSYRALDPQKKEVVLKTLRLSAVDLGVLNRSLDRLEADGWPDGLVPVIGAGLGENPPMLLFPAYFELLDRGGRKPRSLQQRLGDLPDDAVCRILREMASALAAMHARGVVHGNLKPSNILFDGGGRLFLADWGLRNPATAKEVPFTDAILYQPPDQLRRLVSAAGEPLTWDVFAFAVTAYRLMTGAFPRCHAAYAKVAPPPGQDSRDAGLVVDLEKITANLNAESEVAWPPDFIGRWGAGWHDLLDRCLSLNPERRPATMQEVAEAIRLMEDPSAHESVSGSTENEHPEEVSKPRKSESSGRWRVVAAMAALAILSSIAFLLLYGEKLKALRQAHEDRTQVMEERDRLLGENRKLRDAATLQARQHEQERAAWKAQLQASRQQGDLIFAWAMEKDGGRWPSFQGREARLRHLERNLQTRWDQADTDPQLGEQRGLLGLQLAEISLSRGDASEAYARLENIRDLLPADCMDTPLRLRLAKDLLLVSLAAKGPDVPVEDLLARCEALLAGISNAKTHGHEVECMKAILAHHEARVLADQGEEEEALSRLVKATRSLNELAEAELDGMMLRSELADSRLFAADVLDGAGRHADALEVRALAVRELQEFSRRYPSRPEIRLELAGCMAAAAEAALWAGDAQAAEGKIEEAMRVLDSLHSSGTATKESDLRRAMLLSIQAGIQWETGKMQEAAGACEEAIRLLEAGDRSDAMVAYRLALAWWSKGRLETGEDHQARVAALEKAEEILEGIPLIKRPHRPGVERMHRAAVYLSVDMAHAYQSGGRREDALRVLNAALSDWDALVRLRPDQAEYQEGRIWCRQRIEDLGK